MRGRCPKCGYIFDHATTIDDEKLKPREGDISFCINCGAVNTFDDIGVVPVDESKLDESTRQEIARIRKAWESVT